MRAVSESISGRNRAMTELKKLFERQPPPSTRLILAGTEPRLLGAPVKTWSEINSVLNEWTCWSPMASLDRAITLASEVGNQQANILVLSDQPPPDRSLTSDRLQWRAIGSATDNLAIVNASRTALGDQDRCLLEIANLSPSPQRSRLTVHSGTNVVQAATLEVGPRERQRFVFNITPSTPVLQAALDADSLDEDNAVQLLPPIRKRVRVQLALSDSALSEIIERALDATGLRAAISVNPELVVHDSSGTPAGSNAWSLRWISSTNVSAYTGPFVIDAAHPLAEGIALHGVIWAGEDMTNAPTEIPVILAGNVPLVSVREDATGRRHITLNINTRLSTIQTTPDWPILFWNLLQWRASESPGLQQSNARLGTDVTLKTAGDAVNVTWPDGTVKSFPTTADQLALETPMPGIYTVAMGQTTNTFAVNALAADESDMASCASGQWGQWREDSERRFEEASVTWMFGLGALALMAVHLFLLARGKAAA
jgi:hypothetical protein